MSQILRHRTRQAIRTGDRRTPVLTTVTSAVVAATIVTGLGTGAASAVEQGGTSPGDTAPEQGGTTGEVLPEQGGTSPTPPPVSVPGPGSVPAPPQEAPYQPYWQPETSPEYEGAYNPVPNGPITLPKPTAPVRPIAPPPNKIRIGNFVTPIPQGMSHRDVNSINAWAAYGESKIAQGLISIGVPEDEASRQAAATIIGVIIGGTAGAITVGIPSGIVGAAAGALVGGGIGAGIGALAGAAIGGATAAWSGPGLPGAIGAGAGIGAGIGGGAGALIGAGIGGVGGLAVGSLIGALAGGTIGGVIAHTLGAGDPGADPRAPWLQDGKPQDPRSPKATPPRVTPLPNPGGNQYEVHLPADKASKAGLPSVDYVVNVRGDVRERSVGKSSDGRPSRPRRPTKSSVRVRRRPLVNSRNRAQRN